MKTKGLLKRKFLKITALVFSNVLLSTASADILYTSDFETDDTVISKSSYAPMYNSGNPPTIVKAENGITPRGGSHMMKTYLHRYNSKVTYGMSSPGLISGVIGVQPQTIPSLNESR